MRQGLERRIGSFLLNRVCRSMLDTPPLRTDDTPLVFASMVSHADLLRYLLAIKSIHRSFNRGRMLVLNDGSLTEADIAVLRHHLRDPEVVPIKNVDIGPCPVGGCWERLLAICALARDNYVVQVDSDLLGLSPLDEVVAAVEANASFTQGGGPGQAVTDAETIAAAARADGDSSFIGSLAERVMDVATLPMGRRYVHGSAGFAGFPRGEDLRPHVHALSVEMSRRLGADKWNQWGSEQVASNYIVANCAGATALDYATYPIHLEGHALDRAKLIHFIGSYRYKDGTYRRHARRVITELQAGTTG